MTESTDTSRTQVTPFLAETTKGRMLGVLTLGAFVGALVVGASFLIEQYLAEPILCRSPDAFALCADGGGVAFNIATVLMGIIGVVGLVKMSVYRPLLVAIATAVSLWSAHAWFGMLPWYEMLAWLAGLYAVLYGLFTWVLRIANFVLAFLLVVVLVVAARIVLQM